MVAELYIVPESFAHNATFSKQEIEEKTIALAYDFTTIKHYKETNRLYVNPLIYDVVFIDGLTISDLLFTSQDAKKIIDRDVYVSLQRIIVETETTDLSTEDVIEILIPQHNENQCHGLVAFHIIEGVNYDFQLIYNLGGWYKFRRTFLGMYPKNAHFFIDECGKYFPNLYIHPRNKDSIKDILNVCPRKIVYHLEALNDHFRKYQEKVNNRNNALKEFSIDCKLDETATLEGNASRKANFTFDFTDVHGNTVKVCCEPHLKLCYNDAIGDTSYSTDRRIYFHEGKADICDGKILIGHIGKHL